MSTIAGALMPHQKLRHALHRPLRGGQADAPQGPFGEGLQALQGQRQMGAAFVAGQGVNLIDNHRVHTGKAGTARGRAHQHIE